MTTSNPQPGNTPQPAANSPVRADLIFVPPELGRTLVRLIEQSPTDSAEADPDHQDGTDE